MKKILAIDVGGTFIKWGFFSGFNLKEFGKLETPFSQTELKIILNYLTNKYKPDRLALAIPYPYNEKKDLWHSPNLRFKKLRRLLKFDKKIFIQNDANLAALAEAKIRKIKNLIFLTLGTGLGSGAVLNNRLYKGLGYAIELGHTILDPNGPKCSCGNKGCAEAYISVRALQRYYGKKISIEKLGSLARNGDRKAKKAFEIFSDYLAILLSNIANIFNPELIVLGGGLIHLKDLFLKQVKNKFNYLAFKQTRCRIEISKLKEFAGVYGAFFYAFKA